MTRFLLGLVVGSIGTAACMYGLMALLPATSETPEREPLVGPRDPLYGREPLQFVSVWGTDINTSGDGHVRWSIPT